MALVASERKLNAIRYVCRKDDAVDLEASDRELYDEDPVKNADALVMKKGKEPTYFILNFEINGREDAMIKDARLKGVDEDKNPIMAMGKWAYTVTKICLKDIQNPPGVKALVEYKKDGKGYVVDNVLDKIAPYGVIDEIWQLFLSLREVKEEVKKEAKN